MKVETNNAQITLSDSVTNAGGNIRSRLSGYACDISFWEGALYFCRLPGGDPFVHIVLVPSSKWEGDLASEGYEVIGRIPNLLESSKIRAIKVEHESNLCSVCNEVESHYFHDCKSEGCNHKFTTDPVEPPEHRTGTGCSSQEMNHEPEINNPDGLMPDHYGGREGWRLLSVDEIPDKGIAPDFCYFWNRFTKDWGVGQFIFIKSYTIRTKRTRQELSQWMVSNR